MPFSGLGPSASSLRSKASAFSLVEMLAAIFIFSVGVLGVLEVIGTSVRSTTASLGYTQAVFLAQRQMEETTIDSMISPTEDSGNFGAAFPNHSWKRKIEELDQPKIYRVTIEIDWQDRGTEKQYSLSTLTASRQ